MANVCQQPAVDLDQLSQFDVCKYRKEKTVDVNRRQGNEAEVPAGDPTFLKLRK